MSPSRLGGVWGGEIYAETKTFLFAPTFAKLPAQLCQLLILLPSSNQDIQMILQEVSSAQKLFSRFKFGRIYKSMEACLCNKGPNVRPFSAASFFSPATMIAVECGSNWFSFRGQMMGFSWKNLGTSTAAHHPLPIRQCTIG